MMNQTTPNEERGRALVTLELSSAKEMYSAQQHIRVIVVSRIRFRRHFDVCDGASGGDNNYGHRGYPTCDDARHRLLSFPIRWTCRAEAATHRLGTMGHRLPDAFVRIVAALRRGRNRLVLRQWRRGACWWNLNTNRYDDIESECRGPTFRGIPCHNVHGRGEKSTAIHASCAEVAGYRLARLALSYNHEFEASLLTTLSRNNSASVDFDNDNNQGEEQQNMNEFWLHNSTRKNVRIYIPEVIYFSHDDASERDSTPWALMSYFDNDASNEVEIPPRPLEIETDDGGPCEDIIHFDDMHPLTNSATMLPCYHFPSTMVKTRREFGYDEPHPRHGRVRTDECLNYAMMILRDVVIPIQSFFFSLRPNAIYHKRVMESLRFLGCFDSNTKRANQKPKPFQYHDMIAVYHHALNRLSKANMGSNDTAKDDGRIDFVLRMLDKCLNALSCEWIETGGRPPPLPPVLCHMDLQPQNLAFKRECDHIIRNCCVASVMDWEEACYADPRFEILLICRKVLANREQAETLWRAYSIFVHQFSRSLSLKSTAEVHWTIGDIEPWLKLETVHSLCTLSLQAMDLLGVGRSPWETKQDLWGKIERERLRLVQMGWLFCDFSETLQ
ncbi:hypothetical protein ACHAXA_003323 [Cyclostephanos tholiformis]|uniref:Aminoglycoside phosphotransferase domain-containing protein n=1 Tax=Cyclostephanos tholiformis TaxID=382380 RepID=A0ABD3SBL0_9STRA